MVDLYGEVSADDGKGGLEEGPSLGSIGKGIIRLSRPRIGTMWWSTSMEVSSMGSAI